MTEYERENPFALLYRFKDEPYKPEAHWCIDTEFKPAVYPQVGGSGEIRTPDSFVRSEVL
jgi:hypothetical protein